MSVPETFTSSTGVNNACDMLNAYFGNLMSYGRMKNFLINPNFDFWQRGSSLSAGTGVRYLADRWITTSGGTTIAPSRQSFTLGQTDVLNEPTYFHRSVVASSAGAGNYGAFQQKIESVRTLAGKSASLSFYAKADAEKSISIEFSQVFGTGGTPSTAVTAIGVNKINLTTSWQKFTIQNISIPSISGKTLGSNNNDCLILLFWLDAGSSFDSRTDTLGQQSGTFDIAQVQLEEGSIATNFEYRHTQQELMMCQRYYEKSYNISIDPGTSSVPGDCATVSYSTAYLTNGMIFYKVPKRATATPVTYSYTGAINKIRDMAAASDITPDIAEANENSFYVYSNSAAFTAGRLHKFHWVVDPEL